MKIRATEIASLTVRMIQSRKRLMLTPKAVGYGNARNLRRSPD
jgi:hypothetical protein